MISPISLPDIQSNKFPFQFLILQIISMDNGVIGNGDDVVAEGTIDMQAIFAQESKRSVDPLMDLTAECDDVSDVVSDFIKESSKLLNDINNKLVQLPINLAAARAKQFDYVDAQLCQLSESLDEAKEKFEKVESGVLKLAAQQNAMSTLIVTGNNLASSPVASSAALQSSPCIASNSVSRRIRRVASKADLQTSASKRARS
jgi:hypothetical protein